MRHQSGARPLCWLTKLKPKSENMSQALNIPMHRDPIINDIFSKLTDMHYLILIEAIFAYHNLESTYLTTFACQFSTQNYEGLPFNAVPRGEILQRKKDGIFQEVPSVLALNMSD